MKTDDVIVICGNSMVRVSHHAFELIILAAGQMEDDWFDWTRDSGVPSSKARAAFLALQKLQGITR